MKKLLILAAILFPMLMISCGNTNLPEPEPQEIDADAQTLESAKSILIVKTVITKNESSINLPTSVAGYDDVTVSWVSGNESVISINGAVQHQSGTGSDSVNLTATLSLNGKTATKVFEITVYQSNVELSTEEVLEAATADLEASASELYTQYCNEDSLTPYTLTLNDSVTIDGKNVSVSWTAESDDDHFSLSGYDLTIERDIVDIPVSLKGTLDYDGETAEKTITFTIPHISEFVYSYENTGSNYSSLDTRTYSFDGNNLVIMHNYTRTENGETDGFVEGYKYTYTVDASNKILMLTRVKIMEDGTWYTKSEYRDYASQEYVVYANAMKKVDAYPTLANFAEYMGGGEEEMQEYLESHGFYEGGVSTETAVRNYLDKEIEWMRNLLDLPVTATHSQIIDAMVSCSIEDIVDGGFPGTVAYDYQIDYNTWSWENNISFSAETAFLAGKHSYEQKGYWRTNSAGSSASLNYDMPDIKKGEFSFSNQNGNSFEGTAKFNSDFTSFVFLLKFLSSKTLEEDDKQWSVTEDLTNKKITVSNGHGKTFDLFFYPKQLY